MTYEEKIIWHEIETERAEDHIKIYGEMPSNREDILVATKFGIDSDVCVKYGDMYDLENYDWKDVIAWAEYPSYKLGEKNEV
nr:MAG TPA: hypothetical protein [Caudoviricetes sp.]